MVKDSNNDDSYEKYDYYTIFNSYKTQLVLLLFFVLFAFIIVFSLLGSQSIMEKARPWLFAIEIVLWVILIVIIILNVKTIKSGEIDFTQELMNLFGNYEPEIKINVDKDTSNIQSTVTETSTIQSTVDTTSTDTTTTDTTNTKCPESTDNSKDYWYKSTDDTTEVYDPEDQVFHIPQNIYTYGESDGVCKLFNARLATYDEVERAYQNGGSWCSYGWSADQMALFPTQKEIYNELKKIPGHEHDCGRTGINGGYIKNKDMKFGINCYGKKPYITTKDKNYIKEHSYEQIISKYEQKEDADKQKKIDNILVAPFNKSKWSYTTN